MSVELATCNFTISGQASLQEDLSLYIPNGTVQVGSAGFGSLQLTLENGTGDNQANQMFAERITVPAGTAVELDLCDGSLENFRGQPITFSKVKLFLIGVVEDDGIKHVYVGPMGVANGAQLWFLGTGADAAADVYHGEVKTNLKDGWDVSVTGGSVLSIYNPQGTDDVQVDVVIIGVDS
jgi:hypothetical protein